MKKIEKTGYIAATVIILVVMCCGGIINLGALILSCANYGGFAFLEHRLELPAYSTERSRKDSLNIVESFGRQIEFYRINYPLEIENDIDSSYLSQIPGTAEREADPFKDFFLGFDYAEDKWVLSPWKTEATLKITTEGIVYSEDSLLCLAIVGVELHDTLDHGIRFGNGRGWKFCARTFAGCRSSKSEPFKIYPDGNMESGPTMQKVVKEVSFFYGKYRNVFEECELFRRRANGHYNFEFLAGARDTTSTAMFNYYCNQR